MADVKTLGFLNRSILFVLLAVCIAFVMLLSFFLPANFVWVVFNSLVLFGIFFYLFLFLAHRNAGRSKPPINFPTLKILVPVYNSKNTIVACIDSIKKIKYPKKIEIIVVDDCSTDGTSEILKKMDGITLFRLAKNSGKSAAVAFGVKKIKTEFILCIDSDSYPENDVLCKTMGYFQDPKVGAVTCLILPDKTKTVIQKLQHFEYLSSFGMNNSLLSEIGSSYVVPGPMTIFRKSVFDSIGSFEEGLLAEDMDFGLRMKAKGWKIKSCIDAIVYTDIPSSWKDLFKQRDRWYRGGAFNFINHKYLMFNKKTADFGLFVMPFMFFTQILTIAVILRMLFTFSIDLFTSLMIIGKFISVGGRFGFDLAGVVIPPSIIFFVMIYILAGVYFFVSFWFARKLPKLRDLPIIAILIFIYPYFITFTYSQGYFKEMIGVRAKWVRVST